MALYRNLALSSVLMLALASCGSDNTAPEPLPPTPQQASVEQPNQQQRPAIQADEQRPSVSDPDIAPAASPQLNAGELVGLVYGRFKENFPQVADFRTDPVISRVEPVSGVELFEIVTPHGIFYTDRNASWILEGVLFMPDPTSDQTAAQTGLPNNMVNITLRPDVQNWYGERRDKEAAAQSMGDERISGAEFYQSMPREKAVVLDYGNPNEEVQGQSREIVLVVDIDDQATHDLFHALEQVDENSLNLRIFAFPVGVEEIRPHTLPRSSALLCSGFDPSNPGAENSERVSDVWHKFLSDPSTVNMPQEAWLAWAQQNSIAPQAHESCPRQIEPAVFTRLVGTLGLSGTPRAVFSNGSDLVGSFTVSQLLEVLQQPQTDQSSVQ